MNARDVVNVVPWPKRVCARVADFQFKAEMFAEDQSTDGGYGRRSERPEFPLQKWQEALQHSLLADQMYFL